MSNKLERLAELRRRLETERECERHLPSRYASEEIKRIQNEIQELEAEISDELERAR